MALFDLENLTSTFSDFVRAHDDPRNASQRDTIKNAAHLIFRDAYSLHRVTLLNPFGWVTRYCHAINGDTGERIELGEWFTA